MRNFILSLGLSLFTIVISLNTKAQYETEPDQEDVVEESSEQVQMPTKKQPAVLASPRAEEPGEAETGQPTASSDLSAESASQDDDIVDTILGLEVVRDQKADVVYCIRNEDYRSDFTGGLHGFVDQVRSQHLAALKDGPIEDCVNLSYLERKDFDISRLSQFIKSKKNISIEVSKLRSELNLNSDSQSSASKIKLQPTSSPNPVFIVMRASVVGVIAAKVTQAVRPAFDFGSNKGQGENITIGEGALISTIVDVVQRAYGSTDNDKIELNDAAGVFLAGMLKTKDPNIMGVSIIIGVSQIPVVQDAATKLASKLPRKLHWAWPVGTITGLYLLAKKEKDKFIPSNHIPGMVGYGVLAWSIASSHHNKTMGFLVAEGVGIVDEICDGVSKVCKGRRSAMDMLTLTIGAWAGAELSGKLPAGLFIMPIKKGVYIGLQKQL